MCYRCYCCDCCVDVRGGGSQYLAVETVTDDIDDSTSLVSSRNCSASTPSMSHTRRSKSSTDFSMRRIRSSVASYPALDLSKSSAVETRVSDFLLVI